MLHTLGGPGTNHVMEREAPFRSKVTRLASITAYKKTYVLYSRKYWRELNLAVGPKIAIAKILADLNLAVW